MCINSKKIYTLRFCLFFSKRVSVLVKGKRVFVNGRPAAGQNTLYSGLGFQYRVRLLVFSEQQIGSVTLLRHRYGVNANGRIGLLPTLLSQVMIIHVLIFVLVHRFNHANSKYH